ncbi:hypothetical protein KF6_094 [Vibrio phage vB_VpaS_KF6]|uniref:Uncharacterized protein n=1 Tax=Vibrio phage vB_VpaS_KF6 TaxID=2041477 RepID=A0A384WXT2_9CAUD|nr:hypothetical protein KF6_094 [Vibrio phage vB_VpaS_KF6]
MATRYAMETLKVTNNLTGNTRFYKEVCGVMTRISKAEYDQIVDTRDGVACLFDKNTVDHSRKYTTNIFYI